MDNTTATYCGVEVAILGGYHQVKKGYIVEVSFPDGRKKISFSELTFENQRAEEEIFKKLFKITIKKAREKGHKKGVPALPDKIVMVPLDDYVESTEGLQKVKEKMVVEEYSPIESLIMGSVYA